MTGAEIAIIGAVASAVGTGVSAYGQMQAADAQRNQERIRRRQMELEAANKRRQIMREAALQRAQSTAAGYAQGAGGSSALAGAVGGISQQAGSGVLAVNQGQQLGQQMFAANMAESRANMVGNIGGGISSLGSLAMDAGSSSTFDKGVQRLGQRFGFA